MNCIAPGLIDTPLLQRNARHDVAAALAAITEWLAARRIGRPEQVAAAALLLMTSGFLTGVELPINGGQALV